METPAIDPRKWIDKYSDYLFNYTIVRVNDREVTNDLISETFLAALRSKDNFKGESTERTWLISILKRKIIDYYRKINSTKGKSEVKYTPKGDDDDGDWIEERVADASGSTAEEIMENRELGLAILECMDRLNEKQAKIFKLKTIEGIDTETICKEFQISPSNLWVIIHRARTTLAKCLEKNWF